MHPLIETAYKDFSGKEGDNWFQQVPEEIEQLVRHIEGRKKRPVNFLEIGTFYGGMFYILANLCESNGKFISIDLPAMNAITEEQVEARNKQLYPLGTGIDLFRLSSHDPVALEEVETALDGDKLDILFLDGDHSYPGVVLDYETFKPFVREGGLIIFHDIIDSENHRSQNCMVSQFWNELEGNKVSFKKTGETWGGIGILHV